MNEKCSHVTKSTGKMGKNCLITLAVAFLYSTFVSASLNDQNPFKMGKVNVVWNKAQQVLEGKRLTDLHADLVIQDKQERELKKRKFDSMDRDGLFEADVRQRLVDTIRKYGLSDYFPNDSDGGGKIVPPANDKAYELRDDRLKKILKTARKEGFTDPEVQLLKEELGHHQVKLDEYNSLKTDYEALEGQIDNSLDNLDDQEKIWSELAQKKREMKDKHKEFRKGLERMESKLADKDNSAGKFEDPRVYKLWALAQKAGLDEAELESVRRELTHFENRIRKAEFIQSQLEKSSSKLQAGGHVDVNEHAELQDKAKMFNKKVDKYQKYLEDRIHKHIDEL